MKTFKTSRSLYLETFVSTLPGFERERLFFIMVNQEIWKDVLNFSGRYEVSNLGQVRSVERRVNVAIKNQTFILIKSIILKQYIDEYGYYGITLGFRLNGKTKSKRKTVHRLVAEAFIDNPQNLAQVNHIDGNKKNNSVSNLEWVTNEENIRKGVELRLFQYGEKHHAVTLTKTQVKEIRQKYIPMVYSSLKLAKEYGVSKPTILNIVKFKTWKYENE